MECERLCPACAKVLCDPRKLPCTHVYCLACLQTLTNNQTPRTAENTEDAFAAIQCFVCDQVCPLGSEGIAGLPTSEYHTQLIHSYESYEYSKVVCEQCSGQAVSRCVSGCGSICEDCVAAHGSMVAFESHVIIDGLSSRPGRFQTVCSVHSKPFVEACPQEQEASSDRYMCYECLVVHLKAKGNHEHDTYEGGCEKLIARLQSTIDILHTKDCQGSDYRRIVETEICKVNEFIKQMRDKLESEVVEAISAIKSEESQIIESIMSLNEKMSQPLLDTEFSLSMFCNHIRYAKNSIENAICVYHEEKSPTKFQMAMELSEHMIKKNTPDISKIADTFNQPIPRIEVLASYKDRTLSLEGQLCDCTKVRNMQAELICRMETDMKAQKDTLKKKDDENKRLLQGNQQLRQTNTEQKSKITAVQKENAEIQNILIERDISIKALETENQRLLQSKVELEAQAQQLQIEMQSTQKENREIRESFEEMKQKHELLRKTNIGQNNSIVLLQKEAQELKLNIIEKEKRTEKANTENAKLRASNEDLFWKLNELQGQLKCAKELCEKLEDEKMELLGERKKREQVNKNLNDEIQQLQKVIVVNNADVTEKTGRIKYLVTEMEKMAESIEGSNKKVKQLDQIVIQLKSENDSKSREIQRFNVDSRRQQQTIDEISGLNQKLMKENNELKSELSERDEKLQKLHLLVGERTRIPSWQDIQTSGYPDPCEAGHDRSPFHLCWN